MHAVGVKHESFGTAFAATSQRVCESPLSGPIFAPATTATADSTSAGTDNNASMVSSTSSSDCPASSGKSKAATPTAVFAASASASGGDTHPSASEYQHHPQQQRNTSSLYLPQHNPSIPAGESTTRPVPLPHSMHTAAPTRTVEDSVPLTRSPTQQTVPGTAAASLLAAGGWTTHGSISDNASAGVPGANTAILPTLSPPSTQGGWSIGTNHVSVTAAATQHGSTSSFLSSHSTAGRSPLLRPRDRHASYASEADAVVEATVHLAERSAGHKRSPRWTTQTAITTTGGSPGLDGTHISTPTSTRLVFSHHTSVSGSLIELAVTPTEETHVRSGWRPSRHTTDCDTDDAESGKGNTPNSCGRSLTSFTTDGRRVDSECGEEADGDDAGEYLRMQDTQTRPGCRHRPLPLRILHQPAGSKQKYSPASGSLPPVGLGVSPRGPLVSMADLNVRSRGTGGNPIGDATLCSTPTSRSTHSPASPWPSVPTGVQVRAAGAAAAMEPPSRSRRRKAASSPLRTNSARVEEPTPIGSALLGSTHGSWISDTTYHSAVELPSFTNVSLSRSSSNSSHNQNADDVISGIALASPGQDSMYKTDVASEAVEKAAATPSPMESKVTAADGAKEEEVKTPVEVACTFTDFPPPPPTFNRGRVVSQLRDTVFAASSTTTSKAPSFPVCVPVAATSLTTNPCVGAAPRVPNGRSVAAVSVTVGHAPPPGDMQMMLLQPLSDAWLSREPSTTASCSSGSTGNSWVQRMSHGVQIDAPWPSTVAQAYPPTHHHRPLAQPHLARSGFIRFGSRSPATPAAGEPADKMEAVASAGSLTVQGAAAAGDGQQLSVPLPLPPPPSPTLARTTATGTAATAPSSNGTFAVAPRHVLRPTAAFATSSMRTSGFTPGFAQQSQECRSREPPSAVSPLLSESECVCEQTNTTGLEWTTTPEVPTATDATAEEQAEDPHTLSQPKYSSLPPACHRQRSRQGTVEKVSNSGFSPSPSRTFASPPLAAGGDVDVYPSDAAAPQELPYCHSASSPHASTTHTPTSLASDSTLFNSCSSGVGGLARVGSGTSHNSVSSTYTAHANLCAPASAAPPLLSSPPPTNSGVNTTNTAPMSLANADAFVMRPDAETVQGLPRGKVPRMPGCSMRDWTAHIAAKDGAARRVPSPYANLNSVGRAGGLATLPRLTPQEVAKHNTTDDLWMVIRHVVYDCTLFQRFHPGGEKLLLACGGRDATEVYDRFHAWISCESFLGPYAVGVLAPPPP